MNKTTLKSLLTFVALALSTTALAQNPGIIPDKFGKTYADNVYIRMGNSQDAICGYNTSQTNDAMVCGVSTDSETLILMQKGDISTDMGLADFGTPSLVIANADPTKYLRIYHDGTNAVVDSSTGKVSAPDGAILSGLTYPTADGTSGQALVTNGAGVLSFSAPSSNVVDDTTPQLGGTLDVNGNTIDSISNGDVAVNIDGTGNFVVTNDDAGATGPIINYYHNSSTPAGSDKIVTQNFSGEDSTGAETIYGAIETVVGNITDTVESLQHFLFRGMNGGIMQDMLQVELARIVVGSSNSGSVVTSPSSTNLDLYAGSNAQVRIKNPALTDDTPQIGVPSVIAYKWENTDPDGSNDIQIYNATSPGMVILDAWMQVTTLEGGAMTATLRDSSLGGGNAITSALDCNSSSLERTTTISSNIISQASSLYLNFSGDPGTAEGILFMEVLLTGF